MTTPLPANSAQLRKEAMTTPTNAINGLVHDQDVRHGARALGLLIVAGSLTAVTLTAISAIVSEFAS